MNSEISSSPFPALPVRRRETLEIFDTALKLYRRYFWVLLGWSALVSVTMLTSIFVGPLYLMATPLLYGSVSCCVAAAVRGQGVGFRQCWQFSKPRYGAMLGIIVLSWIVFFAVVLGLYIAMALVGFAGFALLSNTPQPVQIVGGIVGFLLVTVFFSVMGAVAFGWMNMVPIVACLEDDKRGTAAMGRAFDLLKGNWRRVFGMSLVLGLAVLAVMAIIMGLYSLVFWSSVRELFGGSFSESGLTQLITSFGGFMSVFFVLWSPAQNLVTAVLYLDLRVRREALDLEWTAYSSAPMATAHHDGMKQDRAFENNAVSLEKSSGGPATPAFETQENPSSFGSFPTHFYAGALGNNDPLSPELLSPEAPTIEPLVSPQVSRPDIAVNETQNAGSGEFQGDEASRE